MLKADDLTEIHKVKMTLIGYKLNPEFENALLRVAQRLNLTTHGLYNLLINKGMVLHHASQDKRDNQLAETAHKIRGMMVQITPENLKAVKCRSTAEWHGSITLGVADGKTP